MSTFARIQKNGRFLTLAALVILAVASVSAPASAKSRGMRNMMGNTGNVAQSDQFNDALSDFADEHDLDTDQAKKVMANQKGMGAMMGRTIGEAGKSLGGAQQFLGGLMNGD